MAELKHVLADVVDHVAEAVEEGVGRPSIWGLQKEYPQFVKRVIDDQVGEPWRSRAWVSVPYGPNVAMLVRACKGAHWNPTNKVWVVPAYSARKLSEALYAISTRSR
jgi:hypothetical protein